MIGLPTSGRGAKVADELAKWFTMAGMVIAGAFGYGHLHGRVQSLENGQARIEGKIDQVERLLQDISDRLSRIEGRLENK